MQFDWSVIFKYLEMAINLLLLTKLDKGKKTDKGKGKASVTERSQTRGSESPLQPCTDKQNSGPSSSNSDNTQILVLLNSIQENQNIQATVFKNMSSRMPDYENGFNYPSKFASIIYVKEN